MDAEGVEGSKGCGTGGCAVIDKDDGTGGDRGRRRVAAVLKGDAGEVGLLAGGFVEDPGGGDVE